VALSRAQILILILTLILKRKLKKGTISDPENKNGRFKNSPGIFPEHS